jgi:hypothetical protein
LFYRNITFYSSAKLAFVGGATVLIINHQVFDANKYPRQTIDKIRTSLPDTAEAFDQMPTRQDTLMLL